jgi:hypothetical protein
MGICNIFYSVACKVTLRGLRIHCTCTVSYVNWLRSSPTLCRPWKQPPVQIRPQNGWLPLSQSGHGGERNLFSHLNRTTIGRPFHDIFTVLTDYPYNQLETKSSLKTNGAATPDNFCSEMSHQVPPCAEWHVGIMHVHVWQKLHSSVLELDHFRPTVPTSKTCNTCTSQDTWCQYINRVLLCKRMRLCLR